LANEKELFLAIGMKVHYLTKSYAALIQYTNYILAMEGEFVLAFNSRIKKINQAKKKL